MYKNHQDNSPNAQHLSKVDAKNYSSIYDSSVQYTFEFCVCFHITGSFLLLALSLASGTLLLLHRFVLFISSSAALKFFKTKITSSIGLFFSFFLVLQKIKNQLAYLVHLSVFLIEGFCYIFFSLAWIREVYLLFFF